MVLQEVVRLQMDDLCARRDNIIGPCAVLRTWANVQTAKHRQHYRRCASQWDESLLASAGRVDSGLECSWPARDLPGLGFFASFAAPFGGFLSSAIKRAYGIKDFNNLIPGHGGMMDRFDCQFVMFLCTYVHIRTFCQTPVTVEMLLATAARLSLSEKQVLIDRLQEQVATR